ncbi:MAG: CBS domain-containing protein, partial [Cyanobacteria bacterium NC_groundwater_1444_Ag_S-0.65um_54_12]|nr:CBS domain-containing protein [Cyanobacteria bacterium NC_groundwater_1444_Ag_S-0.65um_54_12]
MNIKDDLILVDLPTFDGLAAAVAARRLRPGALVVVPAELPPMVRAFISLHGDACGLLDTEWPHDRLATKLCPDSGTVLPARMIWGKIESAGEARAVTTRVITVLQQQGIPLSPMEATLLYLGVLDGSKGLPTLLDARALVYLLESGARREVAQKFLRERTAMLLGESAEQVGSVRAAMHAPVQFVAPETTIAEAQALLWRTGHGALPVVQNAKPLGILLRQDLDRAIRHGLRSRPVQEAMCLNPPTVLPDVALSEALKLLVAPGPGRVLVIDENHCLIGIIARSDILSRLYEQAHPVKEVTFGAAELLESCWTADKVALLRRISQVAGKQDLYLVGGAVRDL